MAIYPPKAAPFECAICSKPGPPEWEWHGETMPPLCRSCEVDWDRRRHRETNPDRRVVRQMLALANALDCEAYRAGHRMENLYG